MAIETFTSRGDNPVAGRALSEWLTTDMYKAVSGDCRPEVVERTRLKDLLNEMLLQQQPYFDPQTRQVFTPPKVDFVVRGSAESSGGTLSWSLKLVRSGSGTVVVTEAGSASGTEALTASEGIARRLAEAACPEDMPLSYVGTFGGSATYEGGSITETWDATDVVYELDFTGDYQLRSGAFTWSISGSTDGSSGHCTYSGADSFPLSQARGTLSARDGFYSVHAEGGQQAGAPVLVSCSELEPETQSWGGYGTGPTGRWLNSGGTLSQHGMLRPFEGGHLTGSLSGEGEGAAVAWHWDFRAK